MSALALQDLAQAIAQEHQAAVGAARSAVKHALKCGELLLEAKATIGHGGWLAWVETNCTFGQRTAQGYMRLARELPRLDEANAQRVADLSLRDALAAVATDTRNIASLPPLAAEQALKEAKGDRLRSAVSRQLTADKIRRARPAEPPVYETVVVGQFAPPLEFTSRGWPAWRLGLRLDLIAAVRSAINEWPELTPADACEALNDCYCHLQDEGLQNLQTTVDGLRNAFQAALRDFEHAAVPGDPRMLEAIAQHRRGAGAAP